MTRIKRLAKEGSWIVVGQIASVAASLVLVRVLTEHLDPTQYGQLALGLTVVGLMNQLVMGGISGGIGRFYSIAAEKQDLHGYLRASQRLMAYSTVAVVTIGLTLMAGLLWLGYSKWMGLAAAAIVFSILSGYNSTLSGIQTAARQRAIVAFHGGLDAWLKILLVLGVLICLGNSSTSVVIGYTLSSTVVTGSQFFFLRRLIPRQTGRCSDSTQWIRQMWAYSWPFSTWGIFTWMQQSSDRWALQAFATTPEVGMYAVLFQLGFVPISLASGLLMNFLSPILFQRIGDAKDHSRITNVYRITRQITIACLSMTVLAFLLALWLHRWIFELLTSAQYHKFSYFLPWMILASGFQSCHHILGARVSSTLKTASWVSSAIILACLGAALNILGASVMGFGGLIAAMVAFSTLYFLWMVYFSNWILRDLKLKKDVLNGS